jgi:hypothetical protein
MMAAITLDTSVTVSTDQVACTLSDEVVVLSLSSGLYYGLNTVGARIWELLQEGHTLLQVRERLLETYPDVDPERCTTDLLRILAELAEAELVRVEG